MPATAKQRTTLRLLRMRPREPQVARPLPGLRLLESLRRSCQRSAVSYQRRARLHRRPPSSWPAHGGRRPGAAAFGRFGVRSRPRRGDRARLARTGRWRPRHRQVDPPSSGRGRTERGTAGRGSSTSPARRALPSSSCAARASASPAAASSCWPRRASTLAFRQAEELKPSLLVVDSIQTVYAEARRAGAREHRPATPVHDGADALGEDHRDRRSSSSAT